MNIGIDIRCLQEKNITGVGEYTLNLLNHLFKIDSQNNYFLFANSSKKISLPKFDYPNVKFCVFNFPNKLLNLSLKIFHRPKFDELIKQKYSKTIDLFFFPNINFFATNCPYVITCHDLSFELFPEFFSVKQRLWHRLIKPLKTFGQAKAVICVSNNTQNDLTSRLRIKNLELRIKAIYPGINADFRQLESHDPHRQKVRSKYDLPRNFILYLGTIEPRKNLTTLIDAFEIFKKQDQRDFYLICAGKSGRQSKNILKKISASAYKEKIKTIGYVDSDDKVYLYNLAKLFVFPSYYEGFGFPPLEALACGCPTIISNTSSLIEVCGSSAIAIDPYNINDLTEAIKISLTATRPARLFDKEKFSWEKTAEETLKYFFNNN